MVCARARDLAQIHVGKQEESARVQFIVTNGRVAERHPRAESSSLRHNERTRAAKSYFTYERDANTHSAGVNDARNISGRS
jgi:hypothetical protein